MIKLIIFDLDGTLADAYRAIENSLNFTLKRMGYPPTDFASVRKAIGLGDRNFIERFVRPEDGEEALDIYRGHHKEALLKYSRTIPGARRLLRSLKRNYKLAIASNRPPKFSRILLNHLGIIKYFDAIVCARHVGEIKPNAFILHKVLSRLKVRGEEAVYVGDMTVDVEAGRNAGIKTIAVLGGSSTKADLKRAKPFKIISTLSELPRQIKD